MPTPDRTSLSEIVEAGRRLLESGGPAGVTMSAVATQVGVRAPSLYKRVRDREALVQLIAEATADDLTERLAASGHSIADYARAFRAFAHERPEGFRLMFSTAGATDATRRAAAPILEASRELVGSERALDAARLFTAWATGFVSMELAGGFRMGGDVDEAFEFALATIQAGLEGQSVGRPGQDLPAQGS
ncbi:TetR/AcrR family transcriptional regulator [Microbacterium sp.]|uniref:TetR/AcrR family transcriptional regulator n=1 Tax=Microbacterium sp. TaxID=51671 RepID=UPI003F72ED43